MLCCVVLCGVVLRYYAMSVMLFDVVLCGYCAILISVMAVMFAVRILGSR